jgi:hypothetical protein
MQAHAEETIISSAFTASRLCLTLAYLDTGQIR